MHAERSHPAPPPKEHKKSTELLGAVDVGLQARLLVGGLSNPHVVINKKILLPIKDAGAQGITEQVNKKYQNASITQRKRHQQETGLTYAKWRDGFNAYLEQIREDTIHSERKRFLETLGISESVTADDFYNEYLSGKSDIIKFVDNVEISASREQIQQHEDIIKQLGNAFGYTSSEAIDHLIHGVKNVKDNIDAFIREARQQVNTADVRSNPLLSRIEEDGREEEDQITEVLPKAKEVPKKAAPAKKTAPPTTEQAKRATPVARIDLENLGPEPSRPVEPKEKKAAKAIQIFPAPVQEAKSSKVDPPTDDELAATVLLLYGDRRGSDAEINDYYVRELHVMMQEYGRDFVLERAESAVRRLQCTLQEIGLKRSKYSRSKSRYLHDIAKFRFLADNPDMQKVQREVDVFDPLLHYRVDIHSSEGQQSHKSEEDIINGLLGWEVYRQRRKVLDILSHLNPLMTPRDKKRLQELLAESPKDTLRTLPAYKLRAIGKLIQDNIQNK